MVIDNVRQAPTNISIKALLILTAECPIVQCLAIKRRQFSSLKGFASRIYPRVGAPFLQSLNINTPGCFFASSMSSSHHQRSVALIMFVTSSSFSFFPADLPSLSRDVILGVTIPGVALSVLFLIATVYLRFTPGARPHLNRVSFRLLTYALIAK